MEIWAIVIAGGVGVLYVAAIVFAVTKIVTEPTLNTIEKWIWALAVIWFPLVGALVWFLAGPHPLGLRVGPPPSGIR